MDHPRNRAGFPEVHMDPELDPLASQRLDPDQQFKLDLEEATRLSLESSKKDEERRRMSLDRDEFHKQQQVVIPTKVDLPKPIPLPRQIGMSGRSNSIEVRARPRPESTNALSRRKSSTAATRGTSSSSSFSSTLQSNRTIFPVSFDEKPTEGEHKPSGDLMSFTVEQKKFNQLSLDDLFAQQPQPSTKTVLSPPAANGTPFDPVPLPRTNFPIIQNNKIFYNQSPFHTTQDTTQTAPDYQSQQQQSQQPLSLQMDYRYGFIPRQGNFNHTVALPRQNGSSKNELTVESNRNGMVKSQSWTDGNLSSLVSTTNESKSSTSSPNHTKSQTHALLTMKNSHSEFSLKSIHQRNNCKKQIKNQDSLIDFGYEETLAARQKEVEKKLTRVSVLEAFGPLLVGHGEFESEMEDRSTPVDETGEPIYYPSSTFSDNSFYEPYDPFEYLTSESGRHDKLEEEPVSSNNNTDHNENKNNNASVNLFGTTPKRQQIRKHTRQPSLTDQADFRTVERRKKQKADYEEVVRREQESSGKKIFEIVTKSLNKEKDVAEDEEIRAFTEMASKIRAKYKYDDAKTNPGYVTSSFIKSTYPPHTSVKVSITSIYRDKPFIFTCDIESNVEHVILETVCNLETESSDSNNITFSLQVSGKSEYLEVNTKLCDYEYVHLCYKYDRDLEFHLVSNEDIEKPYLRTANDDKLDTVVKVEDISPMDQMRTLPYESLKILLETLENEAEQMKKQVELIIENSCTDSSSGGSSIKPNKTIQSVKAVCALLGNIETLEVQEVCDKLMEFCIDFNKASIAGRTRPVIVDQVDSCYSTVVLSKNGKDSLQGHSDQITKSLESLREEVKKLIELYSRTFRVNFSLSNQATNRNAPKESTQINETFLMRLCALHRLKPNWNFEEYCVGLQIYHGTRPIGDSWTTEYVSKTESFYDRVKFDSWMEMKSITINSLPRESRLVLSLTGRKTEKESGKRLRYDLGWGSVQLFNFEMLLAQGTFLLPLWPRQAEKQIGPAPDPGSHPRAEKCPVLSIELPQMNHHVYFPQKIQIEMPPTRSHNIDDLDFAARQTLLDICAQDLFSFLEIPASEREILWEKRYYLKDVPGALPKVLLAANSWDPASLPRLYGLLHAWKIPNSMDILQLFLPIFPDTQVRQVAIEWLAQIPTDELLDYLPQLVEALKHETWSVSPLAELILKRSLESPRVAHSLYWILTQSLPGITPQNTQEASENPSIKLARYRRRLQMLMRALYTIAGQSMRNSFCKQQELLKHLYEAAIDAKEIADPDLRVMGLRRNMENAGKQLAFSSTSIPLSPALIANGIDAAACSYFPSKTLPLKIVFNTDQSEMTTDSTDYSSINNNNTWNSKRSVDYCYLGPTKVSVIYKVGDDLRQDMLTMQMIRVMDKMWLGENLDLKIVTFSCIPTGSKQGMMEMVTEAKTLREIQVTGSRGVTGSFKETPIADWLEKHNPSQLEYGRAVDNFTRSCAGYSIATYILGICDRHNDNIMIKHSGHVFHIDFGKFLGDAEKFGNFKRDRAPFVLSPDMVYVINGGKQPSQKFHDFVDLCCKGFNVIRKNGNLLLNLFALMASSGIPHVTMEAVNYVQRALLPDLSASEASATFARMIEESLSSWFVQWNFFIHNLAQMGFNGDQEEGGELLSFVPKRYSQATDGRISAVQVFDIQKRYEPERHYVFILKIMREEENKELATYLFRTYKEFCEFDMKLGAEFHDINFSLRKTGFSLGRQEIREVAQRRKHHIALFLDSLFKCHESVAHCDLVYTFFHPLLRDQKEVDIQKNKLKESKSSNIRNSIRGTIKGELKISVEYRKDTLYVMIHHARDLSIRDGLKEEPNPYVKVYLHPDPHKDTKRKTKVVNKSNFPSFMEMLEYRIPMHIVKCRTLQATVWDCDRFQENMFLGAVTIPLNELDLTKENMRWYKLSNFNRLK